MILSCLGQLVEVAHSSSLNFDVLSPSHDTGGRQTRISQVLLDSSIMSSSTTHSSSECYSHLSGNLNNLFLHQSEARPSMSHSNVQIVHPTCGPSPIPGWQQLDVASKRDFASRPMDFAIFMVESHSAIRMSLRLDQF